MALEPRTPLAADAPNPELIDLRRRFWIGLVFTVPLLILAMSHGKLAEAFPDWADREHWIQLLLATPVVFWCGWPFIARAATSIVHASPNMFTLIAARCRRGVCLQFGRDAGARYVSGRGSQGLLRNGRRHRSPRASGTDS